MSFPNSEPQASAEAARLRRRIRIRNEAVFGAVLLLVGLGVLVSARNPAFLALGVICAIAIVAYEVTIATLE